ncbi:hypothetical protein U1Q18_021396 [Sarracenia purpurea var. burkii]
MCGVQLFNPIVASRSFWPHPKSWAGVHCKTFINSSVVSPKLEVKTLDLSMGLIRSSFSFMPGTVFGVYVAQNYNVPNFQKLIKTRLIFAKHIEENYRKSKKRDED